MKNNIKKRYWAFVLYPESAPSDWVDILSQTGLPLAISPLHDSDMDEGGNGSDLKKSHYHIILAYSGPTTYNTVKSITDRLKQPIPKPLESIKGYYRYLTHKDNPEKYQYSESDIILINGFSIYDFVDISKGEVLQAKKDIHKLIVSEGITEYSDLMDYLMSMELWVEYDVASSHTIFFDRYLSSRRNSLKGS